MPWAISFTKPLAVPDTSPYINDCCWGGDVVSDRLQPVIATRFDLDQAAQEDWGWFLWFRRGSTTLAVDIFCDDPGAGRFRVHLTERRQFLFWERVVDGAELEELRALVVAELTAWAGPVDVQRLEPGAI